MEKSHYPEKWQTRFAFFERNGAPKAPEYRAAMKAEPFMRRILLNMNFIAFFFGFIYFFVLGLWRKNLTLFGVAVGVVVILEIVERTLGIYIPPAVDMGIKFAFSAIWGTTANYAYYLKEKVNSQSWNPFEGFF
ncbi:DUF2628 domain-containing protein [Photorhabdus luminescens]|uniref:DUF2628 domain-containing protein n=1 Tax=Photorhabdus luminescens subsp. sonorensis TaxID=1173677 RepID=A0A5C4RJ04_PHOLU|nr:DUF2628 domain-containing protein [Photorhabdus luminescens]TNH43651.1 DUF2628 domain-containing protein [Photorhabdus luminescens subsp. sonorensis]